MLVRNLILNSILLNGLKFKSMEQIKQLLSTESNWRIIFIIIFFIFSFIIIYLIYSFIEYWLKKRANKIKRTLDVVIIRLLRTPVLWILFAILLTIYNQVFMPNELYYDILIKLSRVLLIAALGFFLIQVVKSLSLHLQNKLKLERVDNLEARKRLTQLKMFEGILIAIIVMVFISVSLMSFDALKTIGVSILASAGVIGIVVGLAAQRSVGQILSGMQIAITQPLRLDDVVIIEGEWGHVEEITVTYIVVKVWDERRLVVPIDYFLTNPFQNWTRTTSDILGYVFLYVSYDLPLEPMRKRLLEIVKDNSNWDGRVQNIQVTDTKEWYKVLRVLLSSADSSKNWDLKVDVREKMIDFINKEYPGSFARINVNENTPKM